MTEPPGNNGSTPMLPLGAEVAAGPVPARGRRAIGQHTSDKAGRPRLRWDDLGPYALESQGTAFGAWVSWLVEKYALWESWPACWYRHGGLLEELTALWTWHVALETEKTSDGPGAVAWHTALWRFVDRSLPVVTRRCLSSHQEPPADVVRTRDEMMEAMRGGYLETLTADVEKRRTVVPRRPVLGDV